MKRSGRRVDGWIDDLLDDRSPQHLRGGDDEDLEALAAAIELRSATPGAGMPDPHFVERLHRRLAQDTQGESLPRAARVSRRSLLAGGGAAAVAAAAGVLVGERVGAPGNNDRNLVPDGATWVDVAALADLPEGAARRFSTPSFEGVLVNRGGSIEAMSAACTHLGCILHINAAARRLECPCHPAAFGFDGNVLYKALPQQMPPLPSLLTRVRDGRVEVFTV